MKLQSIKTWVVENPPPRHGGRYFIFIQLQTSCGVVGIGEIYGATFSPQLMTEMAKELFTRYFEGSDPHHIEKLWRQCYSGGFTQRPDVTLSGIFSGLEMACWDIIGKAADKPCYELLGGRVHEKLRSYTYLYPPEGDVYPDPDSANVYNDPDLAASAALQVVQQGFTAVKFDPAGPYTIYDGHQPRMEDLERSEQFCKRIREAVGCRADLLFGTHGQFTVSGAKRMARRIEPYDPLWFEEPVTPENPLDMAEVAKFTSIPIATGERLCTKHEFARVIESGAASILQMNLGRVGGLLEAKKIASMAETRSIQFAPHLYCGPIVAAANIQIATCSPNFLIMESINRCDGSWGRFLKNSIQWQDGYIIPPTTPGLGFEFDIAMLEEHPYAGTDLHLNMSNTPVLP